jgi:hypothetical protein
MVPFPPPMIGYLRYAYRVHFIRNWPTRHFDEFLNHSKLRNNLLGCILFGHDASPDVLTNRHKNRSEITALTDIVASLSSYSAMQPAFSWWSPL